jgi:hypothetical protein
VLEATPGAGPACTVAVSIALSSFVDANSAARRRGATGYLRAEGARLR